MKLLPSLTTFSLAIHGTYANAVDKGRRCTGAMKQTAKDDLNTAMLWAQTAASRFGPNPQSDGELFHKIFKNGDRGLVGIKLMVLADNLVQAAGDHPKFGIDCVKEHCTGLSYDVGHKALNLCPAHFTAPAKPQGCGKLSDDPAFDSRASNILRAIFNMYSDNHYLATTAWDIFSLEGDLAVMNIDSYVAYIILENNHECWKDYSPEKLRENALI